MKRYRIEQKFKTLAAFLVILILLPYIISVFVNGVNIAAEDGGGAFYVRVRVPDTEEADGIAEVDWTEYLAGILARDVPEDTAPEAMKAQAVVIRTQIYRELEQSQDKILTETWLSRAQLQKQWGQGEFQANYQKYTDAVEQTDDTVLVYGESYAWTPFHQSSIGKTRSAAEVMGTEEYPYIAVRECPLDKEADEEIQVFTFTCRQIQELCREFLVAAADGEQAEKGYSFEDFEILSADSAGYVKELRIGETVCTGDLFRDALSLPSSAFSFAEGDSREEEGAGQETMIKITTTGKGHGLGMSLWTAEQMAEKGKTCEEILAFFYEGTQLRIDMPETDLF